MQNSQENKAIHGAYLFIWCTIDMIPSNQCDI